ncbi:hypothetical protein ASF56_24305 [Methylobacterium sp. Leaf122]|nr:hypothetical protein [Methylobacterium sp. Leaf122]KQQ14380.1 hypothetical protein ASF56_24305 [Methylobacterium sp. Leaf122]
MGSLNDIAVGIHIVRVYMDSGVGGIPTVQLWVAAVPHGQAEEAVQKAIPAGWRAELTRDTLTKETVARMKIRAGEVRQLAT